MKSNSEVTVTAVTLLSEKILLGIKNADFRVREALPTIRKLVERYHCSHHTLREAITQLVKSGWLFKQGQRVYINQAKGAPKVTQVYESKPIVVVVEVNARDWHFECLNERSGDFGRTFVMEAERMGIGIKLLSLNKPPISFIPMVSGINGIIRYMEEIKHRYIGAVFCPHSTGTTLQALLELIPFFLKFKKPLIWFDKNDTNLEKNYRLKGVYRCHFNELAALQLCIEELHRKGHRRVGYVSTNISSWIHRRFDTLAELGSRQSPPLKVYYDQESALIDWENLSPEQCQRLQEMSQSKRPEIQEAFGIFKSFADTLGQDLLEANAFKHHPESYRYFVIYSEVHKNRISEKTDEWTESARFLWNSFRLWAFIKDPETSALIFANDGNAVVFSSTMLQLKMKIPEQHSVVSFDNKFKFSEFPFTSIDFGFSKLGYHAFHLLLADVPVPKKRNGDISAQPAISQGVDTIAWTRD